MTKIAKIPASGRLSLGSLNQPQQYRVRWSAEPSLPVRAVVYHCHHTYTLEKGMNRPALTRTNLLLEVGKVRRLRKALRSRSNSEAVRRVIDERLAVETGLEALRSHHPRRQHELILAFCYVVPEAFWGKWISPAIFAIS